MKLFARITIAIVGLLFIVGALGAAKGLQIKQMIAHGDSFEPPPQTVTAAPIELAAWEETIQAVGTLTAVKGLGVKTELSGKIVRIGFKSGTRVRAGQLLVQQDVSNEKADSDQLVLRQQFVQLGERRGDYVVLKNEVNPEQQVVSTGVFKLRNGQTVVVDNSKAPSFETSPRPEDA